MSVLKELTTLTEAKDKSEMLSWCATMIKDSGAKLPRGPEMSDTGDGHWITKASAEKILDNFKTAGYKVSGKSDFKIVKFKGTMKKGITFDYDDPDEKNKVGLRFFDESPISEDAKSAEKLITDTDKKIDKQNKEKPDGYKDLEKAVSFLGADLAKDVVRAVDSDGFAKDFKKLAKKMGFKELEYPEADDAVEAGFKKVGKRSTCTYFKKENVVFCTDEDGAPPMFVFKEGAVQEAKSNREEFDNFSDWKKVAKKLHLCDHDAEFLKTVTADESANLSDGKNIVAKWNPVKSTGWVETPTVKESVSDLFEGLTKWEKEHVLPSIAKALDVPNESVKEVKRYSATWDKFSEADTDSFKDLKPISGKEDGTYTLSVGTVDGVKVVCMEYNDYGGGDDPWFFIAKAAKVTEDTEASKFNVGDKIRIVDMSVLKELTALSEETNAGKDKEYLPDTKKYIYASTTKKRGDGAVLCKVYDKKAAGRFGTNNLDAVEQVWKLPNGKMVKEDRKRDTLIKEGFTPTLRIVLPTDVKKGDTSLLKKFLSADIADISEIDTDELEKDTEGNLEGTLLIWIGDESISIEGEHFPSGLRGFDSRSDKKKISLINDVKHMLMASLSNLKEDAKSAEQLISDTDKKIDKQNKEKPRKTVIGKKNELVNSKDETADICEAISELFDLNSDVLLEAGEQLRNPVNKLSMSRVHVVMMSPSDKAMKDLKDKVFGIRNEDPIVDFMLEIMGVPKDGSAIRIRNGFMKYVAGNKMLFIAKFKSDLPGEKKEGLESEQVKEDIALDEGLETIKSLLNEEKFSDMIDRYCEQENLHSFEGPKGVRNLGFLVKALGYRDLDSFFEDNSGSLEKVCEWIGDATVPEWEESLKQEVSIEDDEDDSDINSLMNKFIDEHKLYSLEGPRGLRNITKIVGALDGSYRSFDSFLEDNSGAIEAIVQWIKSTRIPEWKEKIEHDLHPE